MEEKKSILNSSKIKEFREKILKEKNFSFSARSSMAERLSYMALIRKELVALRQQVVAGSSPAGPTSKIN